MRTVVRGRTIAQVKKSMRGLERRGYKAVMDEPVLDKGNLYHFKEDSYVMVMENKNQKKTGTKSWG